jgi:hypothetical protein
MKVPHGIGVIDRSRVGAGSRCSEPWGVCSGLLKLEGRVARGAEAGRRKGWTGRAPIPSR